jgi:hypothetical protein
MTAYRRDQRQVIESGECFPALPSLKGRRVSSHEILFFIFSKNSKVKNSFGCEDLALPSRETFFSLLLFFYQYILGII